MLANRDESRRFYCFSVRFVLFYIVAYLLFV
nr:MAG TPA: hypothetical protein [Caudoviricetes sp.]